MKKRMINLTIVLTLLFLSLAIAQEDTSQIPPDKQEFYEWGYNLEDFTQLSNSIQDNEFEENKEWIVKGFKDKLSEEEGLKDVSKTWSDKTEKGENVLSDQVKNELWKELDKEQKAALVREVISSKLEEKLGEDFDPDKLNEINLDDENLVWDGNKIGFKKQGKLKAFIDLEDMSKYTSKITTEENKFIVEFDTKRGNKKVVLNAGSINEYGEIVDHNGKVVGMPLFGGIKKLGYDKGTFEITYADLNNEEKTLTLTQNDLENIGDAQNLGVLKELQGLINENPEIAKIVNSLDFESDLAINIENKLNVIYGGTKDNREVIEIDFDEYGRLNVKLSKDASIASTNAKGVLTKTYLQTSLDSEAHLIFKHNGELQASKNGITNVLGFGQVLGPENKYISIETVDDDFLAALLRGDTKTAGGSLLKGIDLKSQFESGNLDLQTLLTTKLQEKFESQPFRTELKKLISEQVESLAHNIKERGESILDFFVNGDRQLTEPQNFVAEHMKSMVRELTKDIADSYISNPDSIKELLVSKDIKKSLGNSIIETIKGKIEKIPGIKLGEDSEINKIVDDFIREVNEKGIPSAIKTIGKEFGLGEDSPELESILAFVNTAEQKINQENEKFLKGLNIPDYPNKVIMNIKDNEVRVIGDSRIIFNTDHNLDKFVVTSSPESDGAISLLSNGNLVAQFKGSQTYINRNIKADTDYSSIGLIENTNNRRSVASLSSSNTPYGQKWQMYLLNAQGKKTGNVVVTGVPDLETYYASDMQYTGPLGSQDPAISGSSITITNYAAYGTNDPNLQKALEIGAQRGVQEVNKRVPWGFRWLFRKYGRKKGIETAYNTFLQQQDPSKFSIAIGDKVWEGFDTYTKDLHSAWGGQQQYQSQAQGMLNNFGNALSLADRDAITASLNPQGMKDISNFIKNNPTPILTVTPNGIKTYDGKTFTGNPESMRTFFRFFSKDVKPTTQSFSSTGGTQTTNSNSYNGGSSYDDERGNCNGGKCGNRKRFRFRGGLTGGDRQRPGSRR